MGNERQETWAVLGATGFLGRHVAAACRRAGVRVVELSRSLGHELEDERTLAGIEVDVVINAAALARVGECEAEPGRAQRLNVWLPEQLGSRLSGARIVHVSTDLVFGHQAVPAAGFRESDEPAPASRYGATKLAGERALLAVRSDALVVRLPLLFGESFGRGLGASDGLLDALARGERPQLFRDELRTPLDVSIAARALVQCAESRVNGLLHLAGAERLTRFELGLRVLEGAGRTREEALGLVDAIDRAEVGAEARPPDTSLATGAQAQAFLDRSGDPG